MKLQAEVLILAGFGIALLLLMLVGAVAFRGLVELDANASSVLHTQEVMTELKELLSALTTVETSQRGYVIAADDAFLEDFDGARSQAQTSYRRLRFLTGDNAGQQRRLDALDDTIRARLAFADELIAARRTLGFTVAQAALAGGRGRELQARIRQSIGQMETVEQSLLRERDAAARSSSRFARITIVIGGALAVLVVVLALLLIRRDLMRRSRAEAALRELNRELEAARLRAEAADRVKSAFLASMSHELRTPLNSIIGFTGVLLQGMAGPLTAEQASQLRRVQTSGRHLLALTNDILDLSKIEAGEVTLARAPFDPRQSVEKVVEMVRPHAESRGLALKVECAGIPAAWRGDPRRLEQVLLNLLNNATKFTEQGEVRLHGAVEREGVLEFSVTDTGIGIAPEDLDKLFQPFRQIDSGLSRKYDGTGLGLDICRRLVRLMGGEILVTSQPGSGSTFTFTLPWAGEASDGNRHPAD